MNLNIKDPAVRRYIYGVVAALIPLLLVVGLITPDVVQPILNAAAAFLGLGSVALALPNTPKAAVEAEPEAVAVIESAADLPLADEIPVEDVHAPANASARHLAE